MTSRPFSQFLHTFSLTAALTGACLFSIACDSLPGTKRTQGAVIGGATGAAAGAVIASEEDRTLGAIIGAVIGAGGGYVVGREMEKSEIKAVEATAPRNAFTAEDVARSASADLDKDGNVTIAELVALDGAGLTDAEIIARVELTDVVFTLDQSQRQTLLDRGNSQNVVDRLGTVNREARPIGSPRV
jgi:hypothetical protein